MTIGIRGGLAKSVNHPVLKGACSKAACRLGLTILGRHVNDINNEEKYECSHEVLFQNGSCSTAARTLALK